VEVEGTDWFEADDDDVDDAVVDVCVVLRLSPSLLALGEVVAVGGGECCLQTR